MKKRLVDQIGSIFVPKCIHLIATGILFTGCNKSGSQIDTGPVAPDTAAKCVSFAYIYPNILSTPDTVLYDFTYPNVKLTRVQANGYFSLKAIDIYNEFEIRIFADTLRSDTSYQDPYVTFKSHDHNARNSLAPFELVVDSIRGNRFSGSFAGNVFDSQLWRPVTLSGHFLNAILQ